MCTNQIRQKLNVRISVKSDPKDWDLQKRKWILKSGRVVIAPPNLRNQGFGCNNSRKLYFRCCSRWLASNPRPQRERKRDSLAPTIRLDLMFRSVSTVHARAGKAAPACPRGAPGGEKIRLGPVRIPMFLECGIGWETRIC